MRRARLSVTLPDRVWVGELSRAHPQTTFRVLSAMPTGERGVGLVEVVGESVADVLERIADQPDVHSLETLQRSDRRAVVQFETTAPLLLGPVRESGVSFDLPLEIRDGEATLEVAASAERISALAEQLEAFALSYDLERLHDAQPREEVLTDRQRDVLLTAIERGYYDTPRGCSLTDLAAAVGVAKSSLSETLHRAEGRAIKAFAREQLGHRPADGSGEES